MEWETFLSALVGPLWEELAQLNLMKERYLRAKVKWCLKGGIKKWLAITHRLLLFGFSEVTEWKRICVLSMWSASLCSPCSPHPSSSCLSLPRAGISIVIFIRQSLHFGGEVWRKLPFLSVVDKVRNAVRSVGPVEPLKAAYISSEKFQSKKSPLFIPTESYFRNDQHGRPWRTSLETKNCKPCSTLWTQIEILKNFKSLTLSSINT